MIRGCLDNNAQLYYLIVAAKIRLEIGRSHPEVDNCLLSKKSLV